MNKKRHLMFAWRHFKAAMKKKEKAGLFDADGVDDDDDEETDDDF